MLIDECLACFSSPSRVLQNPSVILMLLVSPSFSSLLHLLLLQVIWSALRCWSELEQMLITGQRHILRLYVLPAISVSPAVLVANDITPKSSFRIIFLERLMQFLFLQLSGDELIRISNGLFLSSRVS